MYQRWFTAGLALALCLVVLGSSSKAGTAKTAANAKGAAEEVQRTPLGPFDLQANVVSNISFLTTNYGIFGLNVGTGRGGTFWPRGSQNQYLFAAGAWFAALKKVQGTNELRKRVTITYNPNSGQSWMVPGAIEDGLTVDQGGDATNKNRTYFSTDFNVVDGTDFLNPSYPNWPIWDATVGDTLRIDNYYGLYINDITQRNRTTFSKGPAFISDEDVFAVYKDTDLSRYEGGAQRRKDEGFPLGLQIEQMIYSWGFGDYRDMIFIKYMFIHPEMIGNTPQDTLLECWMGSVVDVDIAHLSNQNGGAANDRARFYEEEESLNLAVQWTNGDRGEAGRGFGYLGFNFLESPAVDAEGFIRKDRRQFPLNEQLGMRTMRNWPITVDPIENEERYNFMSSGDRNGDDGPGDRRMLMATGPFNMRPGDTARIVVGLIMATTATGRDATGTTEDMAELIRKVRFAQFVYDNQFRAPSAPNIPIIKGYGGDQGFFQVPERGWLPLNNAVVIQWDSTAELSLDTLQGGLDFLGYRIYRARRPELDSFNVDNIESQRVGPLGWKEIGRFSVSSPFLKSDTFIPEIGVPIDDFQIADVVRSSDRRFLVVRSLSGAAPWGPYFNELIDARPPTYQLTFDQATGRLITSNFDRLDSIQFTYFTTQFDSLPPVTRGANGQLNATEAAAAKDTLIKLILQKKVKEEPYRFADIDENGRPVRRPWLETRQVRVDLVANQIRQSTRNRTFLDYGDDDNDGIITYSSDPEQSEKLINNIDYYYSVRAYDEGDYLQGIESRMTNAAVGLSNTVKVQPLAARPGNKASFSVEFDDANKARIGGLYNIELLVSDDQRFNQLFAGKTLELSFYRDWLAIDHDRDPNATQPIGLYNLIMIMRDSTSGELLGTWSSPLPPQLCDPTPSIEGYFTESTITWIDTTGALNADSAGLILDTLFDQNGNVERVDTTSFMRPDNNERILRSGTWFSDAFCLPGKYVLGAVGLKFDYTIEQWGGEYRHVKDATLGQELDPDVYVGVGGLKEQSKSTVKPAPDPVTHLPAMSYNSLPAYSMPPAYFAVLNPGFEPSEGSVFPGSYNNGPGIYEVTFEPGGTETISTIFDLDSSVGDDPADGDFRIATFENVPYLNMRVRNVAKFPRPDLQLDGSVSQVDVEYTFDLPSMTVDIRDRQQLVQYPNPQLVPIGTYSSAAFGWRNVRSRPIVSRLVKHYAADSARGTPLGRSGRYYLSRNVSTTGKDTLDFLHVITIGGAQFSIDFSRMGLRSPVTVSIAVHGDAPRLTGPTNNRPTSLPSSDLKAGDKVTFRTLGGAFGYPFDGTKAYIRVNQYDPAVAGASYSEAQLEQVQVVPNPYYVTHEGVRSSFDGKLYFTRLPRKAVIKIFTTTGDQIAEFNHDETTSTDPTTFGAEVWDLMTKNRQRVASQMLIAQIETPDGAKVVRKFTIVVGPARLVAE